MDNKTIGLSKCERCGWQGTLTEGIKHKCPDVVKREFEAVFERWIPIIRKSLDKEKKKEEKKK